MEFPIQPDQVLKFEKLNGISINLYILKRNKNRYDVLPIHVTAHRQSATKHINLLLVEEDYDEEELESDGEAPDWEDVTVSKRRKLDILSDEKQTPYHYVWIKNFSRLVSDQLTKHQHKVYVCDTCIHYWQSFESISSIVLKSTNVE